MTVPYAAVRWGRGAYKTKKKVFTRTVRDLSNITSFLWRILYYTNMVLGYSVQRHSNIVVNVLQLVCGILVS